MNVLKPSFIVLTALALTACASKKELPELDYKSQKVKTASLDVPPDLTRPTQSNVYALPAGTGAIRASDLNNNNVVIGQGDAVLQEINHVNIEREGSQRWLVIDNRNPQQVWPLLKAFWQEMGFNIDHEEPSIGLLETSWAENRAKLPNDGFRSLLEKVGLGSVYSTSERDKFIIRVERDGTNGSRIVFAHKGMEEVYTDKKKEDTIWQPRPNDPNLEAAFLGRFMQRFGADEEAIKRQINQNDAGVGTDLAVIDKNTIVIRGSDQQRNFRRVGLALDRIGLTVVDQNIEQLLYLVQPALAESSDLANKKPGLFSRMFGKKAEKAPEQLPALMVKMQPSNTGATIVLLNQDGTVFTGQELNQYLSRLQTELR